VGQRRQWERRPRLFCERARFLGRRDTNAHEMEEEAVAETLTILHEFYADTIEKSLAITVVPAVKERASGSPAP